MSEMSIASGLFEITASKESKLAFLRMHEIFKKWDYRIVIFNAKQTIENIQNDTHDLKMIRFEALAYNNFEETLNNLMYWLKTYRDYHRKHMKDTWSEQNEKDWQQLINHSFKIHFRYLDYDRTEFLVREETILSWSDHVDSIKQVTETKKFYETNAQNYDRLTDESVYDYTDYTIRKIQKHDYPLKALMAHTNNYQNINLNKITKNKDLFLNHLKSLFNHDQEIAPKLVGIKEWLDDDYVIESIHIVYNQHFNKDSTQD